MRREVNGFDVSSGMAAVRVTAEAYRRLELDMAKLAWSLGAHGVAMLEVSGRCLLAGVSVDADWLERLAGGYQAWLYEWGRSELEWQQLGGSKVLLLLEGGLAEGERSAWVAAAMGLPVSVLTAALSARAERGSSLQTQLFDAMEG